MTYCGAIGSVNVLSFLSTDLFDESQENPFLLTVAAGSPTKAPALPSRASFTGSSTTSKATSAELPLDDTPQAAYFGLPFPVKTEAARDVEPAVSPHQYSPGRTVQFMDVSPLRSILKRQSSYESSTASSTASMTASAADYHAGVYEQQ